MYAAAGGASCRNARKRQAQQLTKDKEAKALKEKLALAKAELSAPSKSKQFHQLPANYLRAPHHPQGRKLSAGYTGHSKLLLPISEQSAQHHSPSQLFLNHDHHNHHHQFGDYINVPRTPTIGQRELRLGVEIQKTLTKSATANFPLASSQDIGTPPETPKFCFNQQSFFKESPSNLLTAQHPIQIQIPIVKDGIIITPATPLPSPSQSANNNHQKQQDNQQQIIQDEYDDDFPNFPLERACSVYRNKKLGTNEPTTINITEIDEQNQQQFFMGGLPNGHHTHWTGEFCDSENRGVGVCTCDHIEVIFIVIVQMSACQ